jgi:hypothetical protein
VIKVATQRFTFHKSLRTMTTADIINIVSTVAIVQLVSDLLANYFIYRDEAYHDSVDSYRRGVTRLQSLQAERDKELAKAASNTKQREKMETQYNKKVLRMEEEVGALKTKVVARHSVPNFVVSIVFLITFRVFSTEYTSGSNPRVVAILPFMPPFASITTKYLIARGLNFPEQGVDYDAMYQQEFSHHVLHIHQAYVHKL